MYMKLTVLIVFGTLLAAALVLLRQQRLDTAHAMADLHRQIDQSRQAMWQMQTQIADQLDPQALRRALAGAQLTMEPIEPPPVRSAQRVRLAAEDRDAARE